MSGYARNGRAVTSGVAGAALTRPTDSSAGDSAVVSTDARLACLLDAPDAPPLVHAVLVRAHLHQRRLHDAGGGGRLADLRPHPRSLRPRPGRTCAIRAARGALRAHRPGCRP